ncbi:unnamed protein product [Sphagnum balticum]
MTMTTFNVSTAALHLLAIACIMLVVVQAGLTVFQAAACELLRLPCAVQSSNDDYCSATGTVCLAPWECCSRVCLRGSFTGWCG